jgi:hypothetical protein
LEEGKERKKVLQPYLQNPSSQQNLFQSTFSSSSLLTTATSFFDSEIKFIKPLDGVIAKRETITFTKDRKNRTVFINKIVSSGIMRMFVSLSL